MIQRLYAHNYRCFENFELNLKSISSCLLIGKNGSGKSAVGDVLDLFQKIGRGTNRVGELLTPTDFAWGNQTLPMRFELEALIDQQPFKYEIAFELPNGFRELRVFEEKLSVENTPIYTRDLAQVTLFRTNNNSEATFLVDWHLVALPIISASSEKDPVQVFKSWLSMLTILSPIPDSISGDSTSGTLHLKKDGSNFADWLEGLLGAFPAAYADLDNSLKQVLPDFKDFQRPSTGSNSKKLVVQFARERQSFRVDFEHLSSGEKCFFIWSALLAANKHMGGLFCFWDEADNHLSLSEIGHFISALRQSYQQEGQIILTTHSEEIVRRFSHENTFYLGRKSHLEPTIIRPLSEVYTGKNIVHDLLLDDIEL